MFFYWKEECSIKLNEKLILFEQICGDWNFRNIDMTEPHLQGINIQEDEIKIFCEKFSPDLDDYVFYVYDNIKNKKLIHKFKLLDLTKKEEVLDFISDIDMLIDWNKVSDELCNIEKQELKNNEEIEKNFNIEDYDFMASVKVPCELLGDGWYWIKYNDGSGHLESPDGKNYMEYDLQTGEYKFDENSSWSFYKEGYEKLPKDFNFFKMAEKEMKHYLLKKNESDFCL